jgi:hypothetical protein
VKNIGYEIHHYAISSISKGMAEVKEMPMMRKDECTPLSATVPVT